MIVKAAVIQLNAKPDIKDNLREAEALIRAAAKDGATLIATPENTCRMRASVEGKWEESFDLADHPAIPFFQKLAKELGVTLIVGSISSIRVGQNIFANRSFIISKDGTVGFDYDKIHMFDANLPNGEGYHESATNRPGEDIVLAKIDGLKIGMSICYDLRFPHMYRKLAKMGAEIFSIPAAFTVPTGQAHWEVLLRARAIENGVFVLAPAQVGIHDGGRSTYGHSMIIAPWGQILSQIQGDKPGYALAELDLDDVLKARSAVPSLSNDRVFS
jgi:predicted amidohydrolase